MNKSIWKFVVPIRDNFTIFMPKGARVLSVDVQRGDPQMWALVDSTQESEEREFWLHGTGHNFDHQDGQFIGTFQMAGGSLVFHLFAVI